MAGLSLAWLYNAGIVRSALGDSSEAWEKREQFPKISSSHDNGKVTRSKALMGKAISSLVILLAPPPLIFHWQKKVICPSPKSKEKTPALTMRLRQGIILFQENE